MVSYIKHQKHKQQQKKQKLDFIKLNLLCLKQYYEETENRRKYLQITCLMKELYLHYLKNPA